MREEEGSCAVIEPDKEQSAAQVIDLADNFRAFAEAHCTASVANWPRQLAAPRIFWSFHLASSIAVVDCSFVTIRAGLGMLIRDLKYNAHTVGNPILTSCRSNSHRFPN